MFLSETIKYFLVNSFSNTLLSGQQPGVGEVCGVIVM